MGNAKVLATIHKKLSAMVAGSFCIGGVGREGGKSIVPGEKKIG
jgi:hypothetical protein